MHNRLLNLYQQNPRQVHLLLLIIIGFLLVYFMPVGTARFDNAILEGLYLTNWYAREHVVLCLLPAFVIAGAMAVYISQGSVMQYLGPQAPKPVAFGVASVSGTLLAVCSCTVLPLFGGIYKRGAGLGAAVAFLYSGPAINIMAIVVTAKILGLELGIARAAGAIIFALIIGTIMHLLYRKEEASRAANSSRGFAAEAGDKSIGAIALFFTLLILMLVFANWANADSELWMQVYLYKWHITSALAAGFGILLVVRWQWPPLVVLLIGVVVAVLALLFSHIPELAISAAIALLMLFALNREQDAEWAAQSWDFAKQILPLLIVGVFIAGVLLGRPGEEGLIPTEWVNKAVGGNSFLSTLLASVIGAFMYFSTLTEVPIVEGLMGAGMGKGPALALLLAGPALSLPNMLVIRTVLGTEKTLVYCGLVVVMATLTGFIYGNYF